MVMCPEQQQNANWSQVEIEIWIVKGRNLPRTNSTKCETQNIFPKKQQNEHTPGVCYLPVFEFESWCLSLSQKPWQMLRFWRRMLYFSVAEITFFVVEQLLNSWSNWDIASGFPLRTDTSQLLLTEYLLWKFAAFELLCCQVDWTKEQL